MARRSTPRALLRNDRIAWGWLMALAVGSGTAAAGTTVDRVAQIRALSIEELMDVAVVSSTRDDEAVLDVPSSVTVFTAAEIDALGVRELTDLMNHVPGWQAYPSDLLSDAPVFSSRGRRLGFSGRDVLVLLDGERVNREWAGGAADVWPHLSLVGVERVEFIRGPGSAVHGSNAFLGVVNVVTGGPESMVRGAVGSTDAFRAEGATPWTLGAVDLRTRASYVRDDGDELDAVYDNVNRTNVHARDAFENLELGQSLSWGDLRLDLAGTMNWNRDYYFTGTFSDEGRGRTTRLLATLHGDHAWTDTWSTDVSLGWGFAREELVGPFTAAGDLALVTAPSTDERLVGDFDFQELEPRLRLENRVHPADGHDVLLGYEFRRPTRTSTEVLYNFDYAALLAGQVPIAPPDGTLYRLQVAPRGHREIHGGFAQWKWRAHERATLTLGGRFDRVVGVGDAWSPRAALVLRPDDDTSVKLLFGQAFRAPTAQEIHIRNNPLFVGNPDLDPEIARTSEIAVLRRTGPVLGTLTWFHTDIDDAIVQSPEAGLLVARNVPATETYEGLELELRADVTRGVSAMLTLAHVYDRPGAASRESRTTGGLIVTATRGAWHGALGGYLHSARAYVTSDATVPVELDARAELRVHQRWELTPTTSAFVEIGNLFDDDSRTPSGAIDNPFAVPVRGRRIELGLQVDLADLER